MTVSEVAWLTLKSGIGNIDESQLWLDSLKTISRQPGFQGAFYGLSIEDSAVLELLIGMLITTSECNLRITVSRLGIITGPSEVYDHPRI